MAKLFKVHVVSQDRLLYDGMVSQVSVSVLSGELGILANHTPLMAELRPGQVRLMLENGEEKVIYISGGFLEVQPIQTIILADEAERAEDLDEERVRAAKERAEQRKNNLAVEDDNMETVQREIAQLTAQLAAIRRLRN